MHNEENGNYFDNEQKGRGTTSGETNISLKKKELKIK